MRLTEHDGNALSVAQALSFGAEVVWTHRHPECKIASTKSEFIDVLSELIEGKEQDLSRNNAHIDFVEKNYDYCTVIEQLKKTLNEAY